MANLKYQNVKRINLIIIIDDNCQFWMNLDELTLSSPNYPNWYNADGVGCDWLLSAPKGFIIALEFNHFHVSCLQYLYFVKMITTICNIYFFMY